MIVMVNTAVPVPFALLALMVTAIVPAVVGVPDITPVDELMLKPSGNPAAL